MKLVLLGPPGAGKGTHAEVLAEKYDLAHSATGDILRRNIREQTKLGCEAKDIIEKGGLVPDDLVNAMMADEIRKIGLDRGFILDGYPRTIGQAEALDSFLKKHKGKLDLALNFATSEDVIIDRLSGRRVCTQCGHSYHIRNIPPKKNGVCDQCGIELVQRKDDKPETIRHRLKMYEEETLPLIEYYNKQGILREVPGDFDVPELQQKLQELFESMQLVR